MFVKPSLNLNLVATFLFPYTGADIDCEDENGDTPFVYAFRGRHMEAMELLRDSGCNTEIAKMSLALATKDVQFVKFCHKLDIPVENEDWNTSSEDELTILLENLSLDPFEGNYGNGDYECSPFLYLVQEGKPNTVKICMQKHPCLGKYTKEDILKKINIALFSAIKAHSIDNVKLLISEYGASVNARDERLRSAFSLACEHDPALTEYLATLDPDITLSDHLGLAPIHWSSYVGSTKICKLLLDKESPVDIKGDLGATPLMIACSRGHVGIVRLLLQAGANVNFSTPEGWTALHVAVQANNTVIVEELLKVGAKPDVQSNTLKQEDDIVSAGTPLLIAITIDNLDIVHLLLEENCNVDLEGLVNVPVTNGTDVIPPIQHAVNGGQIDAACLLIRAGCSLKPISKWLWDSQCNCFSPKATRDYEMMDMLNVAITNPQSLKVLSRKHVRDMLGYKIKEKIDKLQLTNTMKKLILLKEISQPGEYIIL